MTLILTSLFLLKILDNLTTRIYSPDSTYVEEFNDVDWSTVQKKDIRVIIPFEYQFNTYVLDRIVGGEEATPNSIPYQIGMLIRTSQGNFFCGGSLLSTRFILTAAHCLDGANAVQVRLGAHRIRDIEPTQVRVNALRWVQHEAWDPTVLENDIAIVEIPQVMLNDNIQLVTLPTRGQVSNTYVGNRSRISGWGLDSDFAEAISPVFRQVSVNVMTNDICNLLFLGGIQSTHVCTSGFGGRGACSGDSGGPLTFNNTQIGIVSFGIGLGCQIGWPSVFTRVTSYLTWIEQNSDVTIQN